MKSYENYIDGKWGAGKTEDSFDHLNPANPKELVGRTTVSDPEDVKRAIDCAKEASVHWGKKSSVARGEILRKAADLLESRADDIATIATKEMGKRFVETKGEVLRGASILRYYGQEGYRKTGEVLPSATDGNTILSLRVPIGVVATITPWNFPIAIPIWKIAPALSYGNTVVWKPAQETGLTAVHITKVFEDAGLPAGVLNLVTGRGSVIGEVLTTHEKVAGISFTGSNAVGQTIAQQATEHGKKIQLELGGKNPAVVLADANIDLAAQLTLEGAMKQTGQRCTATSRAYVEASVYDQFLEKVIQHAKAITIGNGLEEAVTMGPVASKKQFNTVTNYIQIAKDEGASLLYGGNSLDKEGGYYLQPTIFGDVTHDMTIAKEEVFGPVLAVMKVDHYEDALKKANDTIYGLSASLFTSDLGKAFHFIENSEVGMVQINGETGGAEPQAPFGGTKASGYGPKEQGQAAAEFYTTNKTVTINPLTR